jgi:catechol 2,3-dioxygenase-like lactoylglutathione lyase family enzyme
MPIGHMGVNVRDVARARAYYDAIMPLLEFEPFKSDEGEFSYKPAANKVGTYLFFYRAIDDDGDYSRHRTGLQHLAFMVRTREAVHAVHDLVRELGSEIVHPPQEFPQYHPGYYAVFWLDPEGFMVEAVCHRNEVGS